jgi:hypothetical protein
MNDETLEVLPTTVEALDLFVADITEKYGLPQGDDTYELIATMIMHINPNVCRATRQFFADAVLKSLANKAAYVRLQEFSDKRKQKQEEIKKQEATKLEASSEKVLPN